MEGCFVGLDKEKYCCIGDCNNSGEKAHLLTRATIPKVLWNEPILYIWLCRRHHIEQHSVGIETFCFRHNLVWELNKAKSYLCAYKTFEKDRGMS